MIYSGHKKARINWLNRLNNKRGAFTLNVSDIALEGYQVGKLYQVILPK